jgi:hypothetical protein
MCTWCQMGGGYVQLFKCVSVFPSQVCFYLFFFFSFSPNQLSGWKLTISCETFAPSSFRGRNCPQEAWRNSSDLLLRRHYGEHQDQEIIEASPCVVYEKRSGRSDFIARFTSVSFFFLNRSGWVLIVVDQVGGHIVNFLFFLFSFFFTFFSSAHLNCICYQGYWILVQCFTATLCAGRCMCQSQVKWSTGNSLSRCSMHVRY